MKFSEVIGLYQKTGIVRVSISQAIARIQLDLSFKGSQRSDCPATVILVNPNKRKVVIEVRVLNRPGHFRDHKSRLAATKTKHDVLPSLGVFTDTTLEFEAINSSPKKKMVIISTIQRSLSTAGKESPNYKKLSG